MPRPNKFGLDYFPLDVNLDDKMELIEAKHGLIGFAVVIKLYQNIYKNGYFMDATEEHILLFKKRVNVDINLITEVINDALRWGLFNEPLYLKYHVLTSRGILYLIDPVKELDKQVQNIEERGWKVWSFEVSDICPWFGRHKYEARFTSLVLNHFTGDPAMLFDNEGW